MTDEIRILIDSLKRGQYENPAEKISLLSAALREPPADVELLLSLLRAPQVPLQLAAMDASRDRSEPQLLIQLVGMTGHSDLRVRVKLSELLSGHSSKDAIEALRTLHEDAEEDEVASHGADSIISWVIRNSGS